MRLYMITRVSQKAQKHENRTKGKKAINKHFCAHLHTSQQHKRQAVAQYRLSRSHSIELLANGTKPRERRGQNRARKQNGEGKPTVLSFCLSAPINEGITSNKCSSWLIRIAELSYTSLRPQDGLLCPKLGSKKGSFSNSQMT